MIQPIRVQRRRAKDWRKPENTVAVNRGTIWGNPFTAAKMGSNGAAKSAFEYWLKGAMWSEFKPELRAEILRRLPEVRGRNLMCFCGLDEPCHADCLLEMANLEEKLC